MKRKTLAVLTMAFALSTGVTAFAGGAWQQSADGRWWFSKDCGGVTAQTETWRRDDAGNWYSGASRDNLDNSYVSNGWWWIYDAAAGNMKCYYFDGSGYMLANTTTPDGYQVNEKGEWVKDGAVVAINPPAPYAVMKANFDHNQYLPGNYEANAEARKQQEGWQKDAAGWWYRMADGQFCANGWWWIFDSSIQGLKCYYFDANGYMLANGTAPDGSQLNLYGEWVKDGAVQVTAAPQAKTALPYSEASVAPSAGTTSTSGGVIYSENATSISTGGGGGGYSSGTSSSGSHSSGTSSSSKDEDDKADEVKAFKARLAMAVENSPGYKITSDGEDVTLKLWDKPEWEEAVAAQRNWGSAKDSFISLAQALYNSYQNDYDLDGTFTLSQISAKDSSITLLSAENGQVVYDILEDDPEKIDSIAGSGDGTQSSGVNDEKQAMQDFTEGLEEFAAGFNGHEIIVSGEDVNLKIWVDSGLEDELAATQSWGASKNTFQNTARTMYDGYHNTYGFNGTVTFSQVSARDHSVILLSAENGRIVYDILVDDPGKLEELTGIGEDDTSQDEEGSQDSLSEEEEEKLETFLVKFENTFKGMMSTYSMKTNVEREGSEITVTAWGTGIDEAYQAHISGNDERGTKWGFMKSTASLTLKLLNDDFWDDYRKDSQDHNGYITVHIVSAEDKDLELLTYENGVCKYDITE